MDRTKASESPGLKISSIPSRNRYLWDIFLVFSLLIGAYFRFIGLDWDNDHHLHPDERFLTMVETSIEPVDRLSEYFDTEQSSLNPNNRGYGFYVYGTLPLFTVRYIAEWVNRTGYSEVYLVGRGISAAADLLTILLVYLIAENLYRKKAISLLAAAFSSFSVLQIQLSHYFTVDIFANLLSTLTFYFAIRIFKDTDPQAYRSSLPAGDKNEQDFRRYLRNWRTILPYLLFGISFGMAAASKISAAPLAVLLPGAVLLNYLRFSPEERKNAVGFFIRDVAAAGLISILVFRVFQPYAFTGPGFLGMTPNESWIESLKQLSGQSGGDVDFPPALQWARRPIWYGLQNMVLWGQGLPLGVLSWIGFAWMGYRMIRGNWYNHALIWGWTALYFGWQSLNFTSSMRYFLPIYPMLQIIAAWMLVVLWDAGKTSIRKVNWLRIASVTIGGIVLFATLAYAFAFSRIYTRQVTRIQASEWIYQNVPAPINLRIAADNGMVNHPVPYTLAEIVSSEKPVILAFQPQFTASISGIEFSHLLGKESSTSLINFTAWISNSKEEPRLLTSATVSSTFPGSPNDPRGSAYILNFMPFLEVSQGETYYLFIETLESNSAVQMAGPITLKYLKTGETLQQPLPHAVELLSTESSYMVTLNSHVDGLLTGVYFPHIVDWEANGSGNILEINILETPGYETITEVERIEATFSPDESPRGSEYEIHFDNPVPVVKDEPFTLQLRLSEGEGKLAFYGSMQALESTWDDPLPYSLHGYSVFDYLNGVYRTDLNFEMYWDDNQEKRERFYWILDQADYLFISSSRQWGTTVRVPERYPLTTAYYRNLIGCPLEEDILWCYSVAEPGQFSGKLGFELIQTFQSEPNLGSFELNTQFAEEAFTVYDHPKVLIFKKTDHYSSQKVRDILGAVDLTKVIHLTPKEASEYEGNLVLSEERWAEQQNSGTWSELFKRESPLNQYPVLGLLSWYAVISLIGYCAYPLTRTVFRGLMDHGYPLSKLFGLLLLTYMVWISGSLGAKFSRLTISISFLVFAGINLWILLRNPRGFVEEIKANWKYFLVIEAIFLGVFVLDLLIRLGNPDLWHPYKGGEKPMDFSYLNAVLKSTTFPPYDPWFAGGYINYYYFGFVIVGVPVKWLGIVPSTAYNLILPTLMAFLAMGTFCLGSNIVADRKKHDAENKENWWIPGGIRAFIGGSSTTVMMVFLGNLATLRMIWHGIMRLAATGSIEDGNIFARLSWTIKGIGEFLSGKSMSYMAGDWYWIPSRVYPNEPITEFPFFTYLYADLHAHLIALPITVLALCFAISFIRYSHFGKNQNSSKTLTDLAITVGFGALIVGALRPTNTWDLPTYLLLGVLSIFFGLNQIRHKLPDLCIRYPILKKLIYSSLFAGVFVLLAFMFYQPFARWYGQGYNSVRYWEGDHSPFWSYITHWGLFLFLILSWMFWETREWMASTPVSALYKLRPYLRFIQLVFVLLLAAVIALLILGVGIGWFVLPSALWAALLLLRPGQSSMKRAVLFMVGSALVLTLAVELMVLEGDIGRMNTVFKFYLQAWTLFSVSAGAAFVWLLPAVLDSWKSTWRTVWQLFLAALVGAAALFPLLGGLDKIRDRMNKDAPHTLDGMEYMAFSEYSESGVTMDLEQDYQAILWMQENIVGSPVIVEANTPEYRWGSRYTIYTGLPGVVGWNWHQRQQRAVVTSAWVTDRVEEIDQFYRTMDREQVEGFLNKYDVKYIVFGQLEKAYYQCEGLTKFELWEKDIWVEIYRYKDTVIYQVIGKD